MRVDPQVVNAYASALLASAKKRGVLQTVLDQAGELNVIVHRDQSLRRFFESPGVPDEDKYALIEKVFRPRVHELLANLLGTMIRRRRIEHLVATLQEFEHLALLDQGFEEGSVTTAVPLSDNEKTRVREALERRLKLKLHLRFTVDPKVIGGVRAQVGDMLSDSTLRRGLRNLERRMLSASVLK